MPCRLGRRSPHPLPSSKPAGEQRGGEQPGRRSLEGVGGAKGVSGKIFGGAFNQGVLFTTSRVLWFGQPLLMYQASAGWIGKGRVE